MSIKNWPLPMPLGVMLTTMSLVAMMQLTGCGKDVCTHLFAGEPDESDGRGERSLQIGAN